MTWLYLDGLTTITDEQAESLSKTTGLHISADLRPPGDYSVKGLENHIAIERKSLPDLVACCGRERQRFERAIQRLLAYPVRCLVIESDWPEIEAGGWRGKMRPRQVGASLISWQVRGLPICLAGDRDRAARLVASMLRRATIHRWRELRTFANTI